ncbi:MAG: hypothetical protein MRY57_02420 [Candidatus Pacebacteria bacterium]|nr:hypothetical protein [Candidatus Paceibacterota bacterium]
MSTNIDTKKNIVIFDIDSSSVAGGIFEYGYSAAGVCVAIRELFSIRKNIVQTSGLHFDEYWRRTQKVFTDVANEVHLQSLVPLETIYCNVAAPWSSSQKRNVTYSKKKPFTFTKELADELIEKELTSSLSKNVDYKDHKVSLIDRKTIKVSANGYPAREPLGKTMNDVAIDSLITVLSEDTKNAFEHIIEKAFHRKPVFSSNTFMSYFDVERSLPNTDDAIIIDISGEVSEIMVIKHDHLELLGVVPIGMNAIYRHVAVELNETFAKAKKHILGYHNGNFDTKLNEKIKDALEKGYKIWLQSFYHFCDEASKQGLLPNTIVIKSSEDITWFETLLLSTDELKEHVHARAEIEIVHLHTRADKEVMDISINDAEMKTLAHGIALNT